MVLNKSRLFLILVFGFFAGCATVDYVVPESEPHARLRLFTTVMGGTGFYSFDEEDCRTGVKFVGGISPISLLTIQRLGMPGFPEGERGVQEVRVSASKPFISSAFWSFGSVYTGWRMCDVSTVFTPQAGKDYEMIYELYRDAQGSGCNVRVVELELFEGKIVRTPVRSHRRAKYQCEAQRVQKLHSDASVTGK